MKYLLLLFPLFFLSCSGPVEIMGNDYYGVIVKGLGKGAFVPEAGVVNEMEKILKKRLPAICMADTFEDADTKDYIQEEFKNYARRYSGRTNEAGDQFILTEFFDASLKVSEKSLEDPNWTIDGGGPRYWSIEYDPAKKEFSRFYVNAPI